MNNSYYKRRETKGSNLNHLTEKKDKLTNDLISLIKEISELKIHKKELSGEEQLIIARLEKKEAETKAEIHKLAREIERELSLRERNLNKKEYENNIKHIKRTNETDKREEKMKLMFDLMDSNSKIDNAMRKMIANTEIEAKRKLLHEEEMRIKDFAHSEKEAINERRNELKDQARNEELKRKDFENKLKDVIYAIHAQQIEIKMLQDIIAMEAQMNEAKLNATYSKYLYELKSQFSSLESLLNKIENTHDIRFLREYDQDLKRYNDILTEYDKLPDLKARINWEHKERIKELSQKVGESQKVLRQYLNIYKWIK